VSVWVDRGRKWYSLTERVEHDAIRAGKRNGGALSIQSLLSSGEPQARGSCVSEMASVALGIRFQPHALAPTRQSALRRGTVPCYEQVARVIRARLVGLADEPPRRLANERELCRIDGVSRITIRRALDILQAEGLIDRTRKRGTITVPIGIRAWRRLRRSRLIKVITSHVAQSDRVTSLYGVIHQGIFSRAGRHGYSVATKHVRGPFPPIGPGYNPEEASETVGVIMTAVPDERMIAMHVDAGYPVVCADYWPRNPRADGVVADCFSEGQAAVEFLLGQGHSNIFYLGNLTGKGADEQHEADADLLMAGCRRGLAQAGLALPAEHVRFCRAIPEHIAETVAWYRSLSNRPTAGVVFSSPTMNLFREAMARYDILCPRDVSLITKGIHGDSLDAAAMRFDAFGVGEWAVDLLLDRASGRRKDGVRVAVASTVHRGKTVRRLLKRT